MFLISFLIAFGYIFLSNFLSFTGTLSLKDIVVFVVVIILIVGACILILRNIYLNMYGYKIDKNCIYFRNMFGRKVINYNEIVDVEIKKVKLHHGNTLHAVTTEGVLITVTGENKFTFQIDIFTKEKVLYTKLRKFKKK